VSERRLKHIEIGAKSGKIGQNRGGGQNRKDDDDPSITATANTKNDSQTPKRGWRKGS
jgi:hypothetical protein